MSEMPLKNQQDTETILLRCGIGPEATMQEVLALIDKNGLGVALVVGEDRAFHGIVTDGDIRRAIMANVKFTLRVKDFLAQKDGPGPVEPLTASDDSNESQIVTLMEHTRVRHIPLLDKDGLVSGLALRSEMGGLVEGKMQALVMAGGKGMRLRPLTNKTPKPLLPIGGKPVIERIIDQLRDSGVKDISISTLYQAEKIQDHFGDGSGFGVNLHYTEEDQPLGTAGALSLIEEVRDPVLVINGDILTAMDFRAMFHFHKEHKADLTVAVRKYEFSVPFGVVDVEKAMVTNLQEKPDVSFFINAGVYLIQPEVLSQIKSNEHLDMTDLIDNLIAQKRPVASFPIHEYWIDIGQLDNYTQAQTDVGKGKLNR
ncbi:MAG: nucleotidyltransferase family protein [Rhodospirillales bacterium]|nr:nucleotidyltransferase family protein [Rhodospirillales bacterium]